MRRYTIEVDGRSYNVDVEDLAADRFHVVVDGQNFDVALGAIEDLATAGDSPSRPAVTVRPSTGLPAAAARGPAPPAALRAAAPGAGAGMVLAAPMPGAILRLSVTVGSKVSRGQDIAVLEAMKMENIIRAPQPGVITEICVQPGQQVAHGEVIVRFEAQG